VELGVEEVSSSESIEGPEEEDGASSEESLTGKLGRTPVDLLWGNLVELVLNKKKLKNSRFLKYKYIFLSKYRSWLASAAKYLERTSLEVSDGDDLSGESSAQHF